jgi:alpha-ribazole phosphatase
VRHLPVRFAPGHCYGATDLPAVEADTDSLHEVRHRLPADALVISSPLQRCASLASRLGQQPLLDARLREIDFGDWELRAWDHIDRAALDAWAAAPWDFVPPGGESADAMSRRVLAALAEWREQPVATRVVVAHGGPLRVLLGMLLGRPREHWLDLSCDPGSITTLETDDTLLHARITAKHVLRAR